MHTLITDNTDVLKQISIPVEHNSDVVQLIDCMTDIMIKNDGIGLAAVQIGVYQRIIVMCIDNQTLECINPVIVKRSGGTIHSKEGCLSFPGKLSIKSRYKKITIEYYDRDWKKIRKCLSGLWAICAQHEIDHLNGRHI